MKKLTVESIKAGKLISKPQDVSIRVFVEGEECEFHTRLKPFDYATSVAQMRGIGENKEALAEVLAVSILNNEDKPQFTAKEIRENFSKELTDALWSKLVEVNALGKILNSRPKTNSSAKSRSGRGSRSKKSEKHHAQTSESGPHTSENTAASTLGGGSNKK